MTYEVRVTAMAEREELIKKRLSNSTQDGETIYDFRGGSYTPKVVKLPINIPVYRMENCRTFSAQQSEIASSGLDPKFFETGRELSTAQQAQHQILIKLAKQGTSSVTPIIDILKEEGQRIPILITPNGIVVNGNRRLSAMRELYRKPDGSVDERFSHVQCSVLPKDINTDEIDDIEADLQARPQTKLDYDWIGDAKLIRRQVSKGRTPKEVADRLRRSKADVENVLQALDEADLYLSEWVKKPGQYDLVAGDGQQIFGDIPKNIARKNTELQDASRAIAWSLFENRDRISGRVYNLNPAFGKLAPKVLELMQEQLGIDDDELAIEEESNDESFFFEIDDADNSESYNSIIEALKSEETKDEAVTALIESCETAIELDKGKRSEKAALTTISQAHSKLAGIDVSLAGEKTLPTILRQIESIRGVLEKIESGVQMRISVDHSEASSKSS